MHQTEQRPLTHSCWYPSLCGCMTYHLKRWFDVSLQLSMEIGGSGLESENEYSLDFEISP
ncbi:hypothetical protein HYDPIDRAFT_119784 [Hydnomerulius pinastri MD-312]|uniref:Uncharacterized protein n=1 Tax=Hydnomerulius pinastri MD-312 TaxID=994086 RepID=A0A0C9UYZ4_9AGAM|nr:hypothetical protein HYDPIDRAFT_119784 [Hydnomerulius pinastri MD-312]